ncbi:minor tail protein [Gordonia phage Commandaria]|uniref:Minor tail protein n=1 Tax=Gordonia phage Commandaria TaxID=3038364 RepID=A0AAF0K1X9_9CAUD|nr:minor tail protein [Gordonia phage Commandaria]WGH20829.1 minor tail protein [Gordonia phage Commandaria]
MWSPAPVPDESVNPGLGWSLDGVDAPPFEGEIGWWIKQQLLAEMLGTAVFEAVVRGLLTGTSPSVAEISADLRTRLVGLSVGRGGFEGNTEVADALVRAYLTGVAPGIATFGARGAFSAKGIYPTTSVTTAQGKARIIAQSESLLRNSAAALARLDAISASQGISSATAAYGYMDPTVVAYNSVGTATLPIPAAYQWIEGVVIGGGGGGGAGNGGANIPGTGGGAAEWQGRTWNARQLGITQLTISVGNGGTGGQSGSSSGTAGQSSSITPNNSQPALVSAGGSAGPGSSGGGRDGGSPGNMVAFDQVFVGGIGAAGGGSASVGGSQPANQATAPGAGGSGGWGGIFTSYQRGGPGSRGQAWVRLLS